MIDDENISLNNKKNKNCHFNKEKNYLHYIKTIKHENHQNFNFLGLETKQEEEIKSNINLCYKNLVHNYIESTLKNINDLYISSISNTVIRAIETLKPSFKDLHDSLDINDFIKIKTIKSKDVAYTKLINGIAFTKNVALKHSLKKMKFSSKKMEYVLKHPKILLLNDSLDFNKIIEPCDSDFNKILKEKKMNINKTKNLLLEKLKINLIFVNKNMDYELLNDLTFNDNIIIIVLNVKKKILENISRCTKTSVLNNINELNENFQLGKCKTFKIKVLKKKEKFPSNEIKLLNKSHLMILEDVENILFQTMIIYGPNVNELNKLKGILRNEILLTVRDFYLQKNLLYFFFL